jgi:hypothetical protein
MNLQLKNIKVNLAFSEETTCFMADIFVNGKKAGYCKNDGRGGSTWYGSYDVRGRGLIALAEAWAKEQKPTYFVMGDKGYTIDANLEHWIDEQVNQFIEKKENEKFAKKLEKNMLANICYGSNTSYKMVGWRGVTIEQLLNRNDGRETLKKKIEELVNQGEIILNTNLPKDNFGNYLF